MLTEQFVASVGVPTKPPSTNVAKDASIFIHEFQPLLAQRNVCKKSATPPNCLAVGSSYIFAAQAEKAVVHVYSREKGSQEAIVPFTERITCITLACNETVLVLGTADGVIFLWDITSGRQLTTTRAHLQAVTVLAVEPSGNFLLSASKDSTVHLWAIPALLSFTHVGTQALSPVDTFTSHRTEICALTLGHSTSFCNIAVSASKDKICYLWDYHTNSVLRTYLLPSIPTCLALDAIDRAVYTGYEDGSVQQLALYESLEGKINTKYSVEDAQAPVQAHLSTKWLPSDRSVGSALCLTVSFDGCTILSGHESGAILAWDVAKRGLSTSMLQAPLSGPVTNLSFLPVSGFSGELLRKFQASSLVKPKFGAFDSYGAVMPSNYAVNIELVSNLAEASPSSFERALYAPSFPNEIVDDGVTELLVWSKGGRNGHMPAGEDEEDFMALDDESAEPRQMSLEEQNLNLRAEIESMRRLQRASFEKLEKINAERKVLLEQEQKRLGRRNNGETAIQTNGVSNGDFDMDSSSSNGD